jgi:hypothetical protein
MKMILFYNKYKSMVTTTMAEQTKDKDNADMLSYSCRSLGYNHHPQNQVVLCIVIGCIIAGHAGVQVHTHTASLSSWLLVVGAKNHYPSVFLCQVVTLLLLLFGTAPTRMTTEELKQRSPPPPSHEFHHLISHSSTRY